MRDARSEVNLAALRLKRTPTGAFALGPDHEPLPRRANLNRGNFMVHRGCRSSVRFAARLSEADVRKRTLKNVGFASKESWGRRSKAGFDFRLQSPLWQTGQRDARRGEFDLRKA